MYMYKFPSTIFGSSVWYWGQQCLATGKGNEGIVLGKSEVIICTLELIFHILNSYSSDI